jgi:YggT family protein
MNYLSQAGLYLIQVVFGFYILLVLLRFLFQLVRADFYNPMSQFMVTLTNPLLKPLRRLIPGVFGIDWAAVVLLVALKLLEIYLIAWLLGFHPWFAGALVLGVADLLKLTIYVFIVAILIRVILTWVNPYGTRHPLGELLYSLTEPLLYPARRLIPSVSGLDLSPIIVFVLLQLTLFLLVQPLQDAGLSIDSRLGFLGR